MEKNVEELEELELERKKIYRKNKISYALAGVLFVLGIVIFIFVHFAGFIFFILAIVVILIVVPEVQRFKKKFKEQVVKKLIKEELGVEAIYKMKGGISINEINSLKIASTPDRSHTEDYISCTYNGIPYEMCDCTLEEEVVTYDSNGNRQTSYQKYFKGRVIKIDFLRDLDMEIKVVNSPTRGFTYRPLIPFETEVIEFNKKFKSYATSKEDGFYILTPVMIKKMLELEKMYAGGLYFVIKNNIFYVLINNSGDSLELKMSKPLDDKQLNRIRSDILIGATIINEFRMDTDKYNINR
ncbi:MAG: DUF3137 domain-containing protein [Anaeroplasmataceae bacterium]|nr:DUF3137 domain-containing protein [Anaeroplasmataceae bacterium]